jgi:hypothetical protein
MALRSRLRMEGALRATGMTRPGKASAGTPHESEGMTYSDEKVANRDTKVWHGATENGP